MNKLTYFIGCLAVASLALVPAKASAGWGWWGGLYDSPNTLEVYRVEPTGDVLVLSGAISYHYKYARFH